MVYMGDPIGPQCLSVNSFLNTLTLFYSSCFSGLHCWWSQCSGDGACCGCHA